MSGALSAIRADLRAALTGKVSVDGAALVVQDVLPEAIQPPALFVFPDTPFLTPAAGLPYGVVVTHWQVLAVIKQGTAPTVQPAFEALAEQVLDAIFSDGHDWTLVDAGAPEEVSPMQGFTSNAVRVKVTRPAWITTSD